MSGFIAQCVNNNLFIDTVLELYSESIVK